MKTRIIAKAIVQSKSGKVLLLMRSDTDARRPGDWDFPGGEIEENEELLNGIVREIQEETSLVIAFSKLNLIYAGTEPWEPENVSITRLLFLVKVDSGEVKLSFEHDQYEWVDVSIAINKFKHFFYNAGLRYAQQHGLL